MTQPARPKLLIIEDDLGLQRQMRWSLDQFEAVFADDHDSALAQLRRHEPVVATLDLGLPPSKDTPDEGFRTLRDMLALTPSLKVIALTGQSDHANAIRSIGLGAVDFFSKPFEPDKLGVMIERAFHVAELERDQRRADRVQTSEPLPGLITRDPAMLRLARQVERLAPLPAGVLLHGESGTGKELFARALHALSPRKARKFVAINCAAIPESLLESELFGYERGAFTGANRQTPGKIEMADGGTLFLDEIGDMPLSLQPKLLRFLQERVVERIGSREGIPVKVRVICATHRDLRQMMGEGLFREDLFYRLGEVTLDIPPLRERIGDAIALAHSFAKRFAGEYGLSKLGFTDDAVAAIESHGWPGNVRELENCIKRAAIFAEGGTMSAADLGLQPDATTESLNLRQLRDEFEKTIVLRALARVDGNIARAAELLGVSRPTIYDLLNRLELRQERPAKGINPNPDPADPRKSDR